MSDNAPRTREAIVSEWWKQERIIQTALAKQGDARQEMAGWESGMYAAENGVDMVTVSYVKRAPAWASLGRAAGVTPPTETWATKCRAAGVKPPPAVATLTVRKVAK